MSDQRMIGDILSERRAQLRLSIDRVASDTKLQPRMIEAFERSDFDAMPPKGYAQATLASYARYLGLDPDDILPLYESQLRRHQREANPSPVRAAQRASAAGARRPSSRAGRASSARASRDGGARERHDDEYADDYGYSSDDPRDYDSPAYAYDEAPRSAMRSGRSDLYGGSSRRSTSARSGLYDDPSSSRSRPASSTRATSGDAWRAAGSTGSASRGRDAGAYGSAGSSARPAAGTARSGRTRAAEQRPTEVVTLDDGYQGGSGGMRDDHRGSGRASQQVRQDEPVPTIMDNLMGIVSGVASYLRQNRQVALIVGGIVAALVLILIIFAVTSCASRQTTGDGTIPVTTLGASATGDASAGSDAGTTTDAGAGDAGTSANASVPLDAGIDLANLPANSVLNFLVQPGSTATPWIEVTVDGNSVFAAQTAAGDTQSFVITRSATITISDPTDVSLSVNGTPVQATASNGSYSLTATVAADQQPPEDAAPVDAGTGDAGAGDAGDAGGEPVADDGSQGSSGTYAGMPGLEILYDEYSNAYYYIDQNGDPNYYFDDGTLVTP